MFSEQSGSFELRRNCHLPIFDAFGGEVAIAYHPPTDFLQMDAWALQP